ncbi:hypothetical protein HX122_07600 [Acinetobacter towneri]|uniref:hypothetical protein n=1 Tax=Acinetobacter towneri TaxID=202956 RepID=UPI000942C91A|nr:hypothetical protein [Acinetobacter towneri]MDM1754834.1 hypothetical protein [Acinetobacter towneri]
MHNAIQKTIQFISQLKLEQIYNIVVLSIIFIILTLASVALYRPVGVQQFQNVERLSQQSMYANTQDMAVRLLNQRPIRYVYYLKLMQAHQMEQDRAQQLPALVQE